LRERKFAVLAFAPIVYTVALNDALSLQYE